MISCSSLNTDLYLYDSTELPYPYLAVDPLTLQKVVALNSSSTIGLVQQ